MQKSLKNIKCFLLDMDGTVHLSGVAFPGVREAIERMRQQAKVLFVTNSTLFSRSDQAKKLANMGIPCDEDDIYTSAIATRDYLAMNHPGKSVYVLGTEILKGELSAGGIKVVEDNPDLVVSSFDNTVTFDKLVKTCDFIRAGVPFLATHPDNNYPILGGYWPDAGAKLALIKASTGKDPFIVCGKPYKPLGDGVMKMVGCKPHEVAMIGDRLMTDLVLAKNNGFVAVLVLTGEATLADHEACPHKADIILDSVSVWDLGV